MCVFKTKFAKRLVIAKSIGFLFGLIGFTVVPFVFNDADMFIRVALLLWYTIIGAFIGVSGVMDKHPIFNMSIPFWLRGPLIGGSMNFVLALFIYDKLNILMMGSMFAGFSPFRIILEGVIFGLVVDFIVTKYIGEGKELLEKI